MSVVPLSTIVTFLAGYVAAEPKAVFPSFLWG